MKLKQHRAAAGARRLILSKKSERTDVRCYGPKEGLCVGRCILGVTVALVVSVLLTGAVRAAETTTATNDFISMFNGKDLNGWEGAPAWWFVRDGILTSESTPEKPCKQSHYLYWKGGEPGDFEMRCSWRITGPANTGVQFRSEKRPNWDAWGYQADVDAAGDYVGCLYQHVRGLVAQRGQKVLIDESGKKTVTTFGDFKELLKVVKPGEWNDYRILAEGPTIKLWINNVLMCEVEDHEPKFALPKGIIALQMHQGPPMKVEFKDLKIRIKK